MRVDDTAVAALAALHACRDALFELVDATAGAGAVPSLAHLSVAPLHRRGHGSVYAGLRHGTLRANRLRAALCRSPLGQGLPAYAVDVSVVGCGDAECSPERGYYYRASRHSAGKPIGPALCLPTRGTMPVVAVARSRERRRDARRRPPAPERAATPTRRVRRRSEEHTS